MVAISRRRRSRLAAGALIALSAMANVYLVVRALSSVHGSANGAAVARKQEPSIANRSPFSEASRSPPTVTSRFLPSETSRSPPSTVKVRKFSVAVSIDGEDMAFAGSMARMLTQWSRLPPCSVALDGAEGMATSSLAQEVPLVFLITGRPTSDAIGAVRSGFDTLPAAVRQCFASMEVRAVPANAEGEPTRPAEEQQLPSFHKTLGMLASEAATSVHAMPTVLLSTECLPVQANWLALLALQLPPHSEPFWVKASALRGRLPAIWRAPEAALYYPARWAIYNFGDAAFASWYLDKVRHKPEAAEASPHKRSGSLTGEMVMLDFIVGSTAPGEMGLLLAMERFRPCNAIANYRDIKSLDLEPFVATNPEAAFVCESGPLF